MFRRFMTVCWVLFATSLLIASAGWYFGFEAERQREIAKTQFEAEFEGAYDFAIALLPKDTNELSEDELKRLAKNERYEASKTRLSTLDAKMERWAEAIVFGAFAAAVILFWNSCWHTGHWIWMGRNDPKSLSSDQ